MTYDYSKVANRYALIYKYKRDLESDLHKITNYEINTRTNFK